MFAVITTGGKQYMVREGQTLKVEKMVADVGTEIIMSEVLLIGNDDGTDVTVGTPIVKATVKAVVEAQDRAAKVSVVKYKRKVRYRRTVGHRQPFTALKIVSIAA